MSPALPVSSADPTTGLDRRARIASCGLFALVLVPLVLGARWGWAHNNHGSTLVPTPDSLEYAAGAQSLRDSGRYYLQVGPIEAQPRYPPGFSLLLAPALALGLPAEELWRVTTLLGALATWLLAVLAGELASRLPGGPRDLRRRLLAAATAGLVAGAAWALSPLATLAGQLVMSDEPAILLQLVVVAATAALAPAPRRWPLALVAGLAGGWLAGTRTIAVLLLAPALLVATWPWVRRWTRTELARVVAAGAVGAALPVAAMALVLARSGFPPLAFSAYALWVPEWFSDPPRAFAAAYALAGNPAMPIHGGDATSHVAAGLRWLAGVPGLPGWSYGVRFWPPVAWAFALAFVVRHRGDRRVVALGAGSALWLASHVAFFGLFFVADGRFYLAPGALSALALGVGAGWAVGRSRGWRSVFLVAAALWAWLALAVAVHLRGRVPSTHDPNVAVRAAFATWAALPEAARVRRPIPFDTVRAQALGLLPCAVVAELDPLGKLPRAEHGWRLRRALGTPAHAEPERPVVHPRAHESSCGAAAVGGGDVSPGRGPGR